MGALIDAAREPIAYKLHRLAEKIAMSSSRPRDEIADADEEDGQELEHLILAVRAEIPCLNFAHEGSDCEGMPTLDPRIGGSGMCLVCEARVALKETLGA